MSHAPLHDPRTVTVRAPAKVNLHLGVGAPRADGFHPLATVYQAVGLYDDVTVSAWDDWTVRVLLEGPLVEQPERADPTTGLAAQLERDNIAERAGRLLAAHHGIEAAAAITIRKSIPVAGGMAGGSADAAATLVALDRLWDLGTADEDLLDLAARLGSDVPFALLGGTASGTGRGEVVEPLLDRGAWWWVVIGNERGLSTPAVYGAFDARHPTGDVPDPALPTALPAALADGDPVMLAALLDNHLQAAALDVRPDLAATLDAGLDAGALQVLLSGSGPTVLALCSDADHAREVTAGLQRAGHHRVVAVPAPVAGVHVVEYDGGPVR